MLVSDSGSRSSGADHGLCKGLLPTFWLEQRGEEVNRKRTQRLMREMGLEAINPKPRLITAGRGHKVYPYLLRGVKIERPNQMWNADGLCVLMRDGFMCHPVAAGIVAAP